MNPPLALYLRAATAAGHELPNGVPGDEPTDPDQTAAFFSDELLPLLNEAFGP